MKLETAASNFIESMQGVRSPDTLLWYRKNLRHLVGEFGERDVLSITINDLRLWRGKLAAISTKWADHPNIQGREDKLSPYTIHGYIQAAKTFFRHIYDGSDKNPAKKLEQVPLPKGIRKGISADNLELMITAADEADTVRDKAIVMLLADTGCRIGGLLTLTLPDLDVNNRRALVREKGRGGQQKERYVYFTQETQEALTAYLAVRPASDHTAVFLANGRGGWQPGVHPITRSGVIHALQRIANAAGIHGDYNPHSFRHGMARGCIERGMPLPQISQILGHSSIKVTADIYGVFSDDELQAAHDCYGWLNKPKDVKITSKMHKNQD